MKILISATLALLLLGGALLGVAGAANAGSATAMHPRSFDYYDQNGIEHTGIDLNLRDLSLDDYSARREPSADARLHRLIERHREIVRYHMLSRIWNASLAVNAFRP
jgi:hypothetical protein